MKSYVIACCLFVVGYQSGSQVTSLDMLAKMGSLSDQYKNRFDPAVVKDQLVILYIAGLDDPLTKAFDKFKDRESKPGTVIQLVAGFKEMEHFNQPSALPHLQQGFIDRYGSAFYPILIDQQNELAGLAGTEGLAIISLSKKTKKVSVTSYGGDRKGFLDAVNQYFK